MLKHLIHDFFFFFWIAASAADIPADNLNGSKTFLASGPPSWPVIFLVVSFNKIPVFSKDLITFIISSISLFVGVIPEP